MIPRELSGRRQAGEERVVRWQYLFDKRQLFDNTPTGWHSIDEEEAALLEQHHQSQAEASISMHALGSGYDYVVDLRRMTQRNASTGKVRDLRRVELEVNRVAVQGGHRHCLDVDLAQGETIEWFYEVQGGAKVAFQACFVPSRGEISTIRIHKATWCGLADDFTAPKTGRARFTWENSFKTASPRVVLFQCRVVVPSPTSADAAAAAMPRGGPHDDAGDEDSSSLAAWEEQEPATSWPSLDSFLRPSPPVVEAGLGAESSVEWNAGSPAATRAPSPISPTESGSEPFSDTVAGRGDEVDAADLALERWDACDASDASGDLSEWEVVNAEPAC